MLPKIVCVVGPTSSGKTSLSLRFAKKFNGEAVNADSRQMYREIGIGTGKPEGEWKTEDGVRAFFVEGIPHHVMDVVEPSKVLSVVEWREQATKAIEEILGRKRLPIVVGGTGLYLAALIDQFDVPSVPAQAELRRELEAKPLDELVETLLERDPGAKDRVDLKNPRRVIRALEIVMMEGKTVAVGGWGNPAPTGVRYDAFQIGIRWTREELYQRIDDEIDRMIKRGWVEEVRLALEHGISENAPAMTSIGYRELVAYLYGRLSLEEAVRLTKIAVHQYAKRQETWFKRDDRIHWVKDQEEGMRRVEEWLKLSPAVSS